MQQWYFVNRVLREWCHEETRISWILNVYAWSMLVSAISQWRIMMCSLIFTWAWFISLKTVIAWDVWDKVDTFGVYHYGYGDNIWQIETRNKHKTPVFKPQLIPNHILHVSWLAPFYSLHILSGPISTQVCQYKHQYHRVWQLSRLRVV